MVSLYDYLGYAAGSELGKRVASYAKIKHITPEKRFVSNPKYTGEVLLYPKEFLNEYFETEKIFIDNGFIDINTQLMEDSFRMAEEENNDKIF
jgi:hypothetical protein